MSNLKQLERIFKEDLPHAAVAGALSGINLYLNLIPIPLDCAVTASIGYLRERIQMIIQGDKGYGRSRQRDAAGFALGSAFVDIMVLSLMS